MRIADRIVLMRIGRIVQQGARRISTCGPRTSSRRASSATSTRSRVWCATGQVCDPGRRCSGAASCRRARRVVVHPAAGSSPEAVGLLPSRTRDLSPRSSARSTWSTIAVQGSDRPLQARVRDLARAHDGQDVGIEIDRERGPCFRRVRPLGWRRASISNTAPVEAQEECHGWRKYLALDRRRTDRDAAVRTRQDLRDDGRRRQGHQGVQEGHGGGGRSRTTTPTSAGRADE